MHLKIGKKIQEDWRRGIPDYLILKKLNEIMPRKIHKIPKFDLIFIDYFEVIK